MVKENATDDYLHEEEKKGRSYKLAKVNDSECMAQQLTSYLLTYYFLKVVLAQ